MAEYIDRDEAKTVFCSDCSDGMHRICKQDGGCGVYKRFCAIPAADVSPVKHGRWKRVDPRSTVVTFRCSECNYYAHMIATNFCPNCGADMREADDG